MRAARFLLALVAALPLVSTLGAAARAEQASFHMYGAASGLLQSGGFCMLSDGGGLPLCLPPRGACIPSTGSASPASAPTRACPAGREVQELALTDAGRIAVRYHDGVWIADEAAGADRPPSALHFRPLPLAVVASRAAHDVARWPGGLVIAEGDQVHLIAVPVAGPASVRLLSLPLPLRPAPAVAFRGVFNLGGDLWMFRSDGKACVWNRSPRCFGLNDGLPAETWLAAAQAPDGTILLRAPSSGREPRAGSGGVERHHPACAGRRLRELPRGARFLPDRPRWHRHPGRSRHRRPAERTLALRGRRQQLLHGPDQRLRARPERQPLAADPRAGGSRDGTVSAPGRR